MFNKVSINSLVSIDNSFKCNLYQKKFKELPCVDSDFVLLSAPEVNAAQSGSRLAGCYINECRVKVRCPLVLM